MLPSSFAGGGLYTQPIKTMKLSNPSKITSAMRETHKYTVTRLIDGAEMVTDTKPTIEAGHEHEWLIWDNENNCEAHN